MVKEAMKTAEAFRDEGKFLICEDFNETGVDLIVHFGSIKWNRETLDVMSAIGKMNPAVLEIDLESMYGNCMSPSIYGINPGSLADELGLSSTLEMNGDTAEFMITDDLLEYIIKSCKIFGCEEGSGI